MALGDGNDSFAERLKELANKPEKLAEADRICSFCGKTRQQVTYIIEGPAVYICDECVELCREIIAEKILERAAPKPK